MFSYSLNNEDYVTTCNFKSLKIILNNVPASNFMCHINIVISNKILDKVEEPISELLK